MNINITPKTYSMTFTHIGCQKTSFYVSSEIVPNVGDNVSFHSCTYKVLTKEISYNVYGNETTCEFYFEVEELQ